MLAYCVIKTPKPTRQTPQPRPRPSNRLKAWTAASMTPPPPPNNTDTREPIPRQKPWDRAVAPQAQVRKRHQTASFRTKHMRHKPRPNSAAALHSNKSSSRDRQARTSTQALRRRRCAPGPSQLWLNCAVAPPARATNPQRRLALLANKRGTSSQERPPYLDKSPGPRRCAPGPTEEIPLGEVSTGKSLHAAPTDSTRDTHDTLHGVANPRHPARPWIRTVQYMVPFLTIRSARPDVVPPRQCAGLPG